MLVLVLVLVVVLIVNMEMLVRRRLVPMLQLDGITGRPEDRSACGRSERDQRQHGERGLQAEGAADPSSQWIGNQPAAV